MMFDWIQKSAIFNYQMRVAPAMTNGRATRAHEVLERSNNNRGIYTIYFELANRRPPICPTNANDSRIGLKYRESRTVAIPPFIRTGIKYKKMLYQKFSALFDEFDTPQLFGTFSCDDRSPGQLAVAEHFGGPGAKTHDDPVLFTMHWKRQWLRFWNFVTTTKGGEGWAERRLGGLKAWCWVFELQDRGTPHTHFCLWTKNKIEKLIDDGIITCSRQQEDPQDEALVLKHQIHKCTAKCRHSFGDSCYYGYPKPPNFVGTYLDVDSQRYVMQRQEGEGFIVGYNMELLRFGHVNMDLQYNTGSQAKKYMCKYITKQAGAKMATITREDDIGQTQQSASSTARDRPSEAYIQHFYYRSVGIVEAIMDICSWQMHGCSRVDVFLPTDLPQKRKRVLKRVDELRNSPDSTDLFLDDKWTKYLKRPSKCANA